MDGLYGIMFLLQRRMMKEFLDHLVGLNTYIKNLDEKIGNFMKPEEVKASATIQEATGIKFGKYFVVIVVLSMAKTALPKSFILSVAEKVMLLVKVKFAILIMER